MPKKAKSSLPQEVEAAIMSLSDDEIHKRISIRTQVHIEYTKKMKADQDLEEAKSKLKYLRENYTVPIKEIKEEIAFCKEVLDGRGKGVEV